jgi:GTPase
MSGVIAIVGRPNVGKSALFNCLARRRIAIVHNQPGVTRDRITAEAEWKGRAFTLVDTGGIGLLRGEKSDDPIALAALKQVELAIDSAQLIFLVVDVQEGLVPLDREVAERLRRSGKPVLLVINKVDTTASASGAVDFAALGFARQFEVSAAHGRGIDALMNTAIKLVAPAVTHPRKDTESQTAAPVSASPAIKLAIVGRPNVGKSSIINAITQSERVIVSPVPGTTRDAVDVPFQVETSGIRQDYVLIDTAGIRKERRVRDDIEFYSIRRAEDSISRCDLAVLVLDAEAGILEQDKKIADKIIEARKACILVVNKWDLVSDILHKARKQRQAEKGPRSFDAPRQLTTLAEFSRWVQQVLFSLDYAPVIFTSAQSGLNLDRLLEAVRYIASQWQQKIPTALLNRTLHQCIEQRQPASSAGHRLKFFYATQTDQTPPTFRLFVNRVDLFPEQYRRYLEHELRKAFGYEGCPLIFVPKARPKTIAPIRRHSPNREAHQARKTGFHRPRPRQSG